MNNTKYLSYWEHEENLIVIKFHNHGQPEFVAAVEDVEDKVTAKVKQEREYEMEGNRSNRQG